ncbi:hypothetical protein [Nocardioides sambongensis]|uniref:hypothetical protein n=1 Tax=Nocardioides sambongensis TaxID=2589074 RepID=UPI0011296A37|nr:hypothetical protein [Nocardioides sambongensis]
MRGDISCANSVLIQVSKHPCDRLVGSAHSILRHPSMPAGCFLLMWESLRRGEPFGGYLQNRAFGDAGYWTFTIMLPLGSSGHLSIQMNPNGSEYLDLARAAYLAVRPIELAAREQGISGRGAAKLGRRQLLRQLRQAGFADYQDFLSAAVTAEVTGRSHFTATPTFAGTAGATTALSDACAALSSQFDGSWDRLSEFETSIAAFRQEVRQFDQHRTDSRRVLHQQRMAAATRVRHPDVILATAWAEMTSEDAGDVAVRLAARLDRLDVSVTKARVAMALALIQLDAVAEHAAEVAGRSAAQCRSTTALGALVRSLRSTAGWAMGPSNDALVEAQRIMETVAAARRDMEVPRTLLDDRAAGPSGNRSRE